MNFVEEFDFRLSPLRQLAYRDAPAFLGAFRTWMLNTPATKEIHDQLYGRINPVTLFRNNGGRRGQMQILAAAPDEIAVVGFDFIKILANGILAPEALPIEYGIRPAYPTTNVQAHFDEVMRRYIEPALSFMRRELNKAQKPAPADVSTGTLIGQPVELSESLARFRQDHPDPIATGFIMMRFGQTEQHSEIVASIRECLTTAGKTALRADDKQYHDDLFANVATYMHGCSFGVAVFERLEVEAFNPNVALEVGYMQALRKPVCLLKDRTLQALHADLIGKLYHSFDPRAPRATIPRELGKWLQDKGLTG